MAGFFPHTGVSYGNYTALSATAASGVLDSIIADISGAGGSVNGWSVWVDGRTAGDVNTIWVANNGRWTNATNTQNGSWTFTNGSPFFVGQSSYGYSTPLSFPVYNTGTAPAMISIDGTTWYSASYYAWTGFNGMSTGSLDRPYAGSTTWTLNLYAKVQRIVLKCASTSSRDFFVEISVPASGNMPSGLLTIRTWEYYPASGTTGSQKAYSNFSNTESLRVGHTIYGVGTGSLVQYVMCLYPDTFVFWAGIGGGPISSLYYAGNLDTTETGLAQDKGACWSACSDMAYSGLLKSNGDTFSAQYKYFGNTFCNRTLDEQPAWTDHDAYHIENIRKNATYQVRARGRAYVDQPWQSSVNYDGKIELLTLDVYQAGWSGASYYSGDGGCWSAREFFRGRVKYLKTFSTHPVAQHLVTHPDGTLNWMALRTGHTWNGQGNTTPTLRHEDYNLSAPDSPHGFTQPGFILGQYGDYWSANTATPAFGSVLRFFAVPIL